MAGESELRLEASPGTNFLVLYARLPSFAFFSFYVWMVGSFSGNSFFLSCSFVLVSSSFLVTCFLISSVLLYRVFERTCGSIVCVFCYIGGVGIF